MAFFRAFAVLVTTRSICSNAASTNVTPLGKAIAMITDLRAKVASEGEAEAKTYDKFACACKDNTASKLEAISTGQAEKDTLQAQINVAAAERDAQDQAIADAMSGIEQTDTEIKQLRATRQSERLQYGKDEMDLTGAIQALNSAIQALQASKTAVSSLAELRSTGQVDVVKRALQMAEMLSGGKKQQRVSSSLMALQVEQRREPFEVPTSQYDFHASDILQTLEGLKTDFRTQKEGLQAQETSAIATYDQLMQDKEALITQHKEATVAAKKTKAEQVSLIAAASQDHTTTAAQLADDQKYLSEISDSCNSKATLWDQRKNLRADELQGLTKTLEVLDALNKKPSLVAVRKKRSHVRQTAFSLLQLDAAASEHAIDSHHHRTSHKPQRHLALTRSRRFGRRARRWNSCGHGLAP
jgi:chromosome segregation ATPase